MNEMTVVERGLVPIYENEAGDRVVDARELHGFLEVGKDFSTWVKDRIEKYGFDEGGDYVVCSPNLGSKDGRGGHNAKDYLLSMDCAKQIAMVENNEQGQRIRRYFIECERKLKEVQRMHAQVAATCPQTYSEALRALANIVEMKELAEKQRDEAIRTKAMIGARREATAMATASNAIQRAERLAEQVGDSRMWKQAKAVPWVKDYFADSRGMWSALGKKLTEVSHAMGLEVRKIEDTKYGQVNAYHVDAVAELYRRVRLNPDMMNQFRLEA